MTLFDKIIFDNSQIREHQLNNFQILKQKTKNLKLNLQKNNIKLSNSSEYKALKMSFYRAAKKLGLDESLKPTEIEILSRIDALKKNAEALEKNLHNSRTELILSTKYVSLQKAIYRCKKKVAAGKTITPINVAEPSKLIEKKNIKSLALKNDTNKQNLDNSQIFKQQLNNFQILKQKANNLKLNLQKNNIKLSNSSEYKALKNDTNKQNLQLIQKNSSPINVEELPKKIQTTNSSVVGKTLTLAEKELLTHAKKSVVLDRAYNQKRSHPGLEILAIEKAQDQPLTVYDEQLLALRKLYPVVFSMFTNEGEEPKRLFVFGEEESKLRCLAKYKLFFPNGWPKIHQSASIRLECELERAESELFFLRGLLENNPGMKKNIPIAESIAHLTLKIGELKEDLFLNPVPTKPR